MAEVVTGSVSEGLEAQLKARQRLADDRARFRVASEDNGGSRLLKKFDSLYSPAGVPITDQILGEEARKIRRSADLSDEELSAQSSKRKDEVLAMVAEKRARLSEN